VIGALIRGLGRSLAAKILLAFAVVALVGIGGVAVFANNRTTAAFEHYLRGDGPDATAQLAAAAAVVYQQGGSWDAVSRVLATIPGRRDQRVVVVDPDGKVVVDTAGAWVGRSASSLALANGRPVVMNGRAVGTLYDESPPGGPGDHGQRPGPPEPGLSASDQSFLGQVNQSLLLAAAGAIVVALALGLLLSRQIIRPLRELTRAARRIAHGRLDERIHVAGHDEVAELAQTFNEMAASLQRTEDARRQLVADVAHELRTPLMVINATVEALEDGVLPANATNLGTIREEVGSLARLVSDLRDLSLGDVGQFPIEREPVDIGGLLESVRSFFATGAAARGIAFALDIAPDLPWILGDDARLRQCVRHLWDNALRHTPRGGRSALRGWATEGAVAFAVGDTGEGIAEEHLPRVFERFFRVAPSRDRRSGGSGLGLAIVQQIVRAHGGEVTVESAGPGHGTSFTIRLPAVARRGAPAGDAVARAVS
jgi:two-component system, OmpR family, sensor histidine kinase BaeS